MENIDFEFTSRIFNENEFLGIFENLLFTNSRGDNFLLNELMDSVHLEYPKHCIKHNMYLVELEDFVRTGIQKDFKIIESKLAGLIMNNSKSKEQYINLIIRKTNFFIDQFDQLEYLIQFKYILETISIQLYHFINQYSSSSSQECTKLSNLKITWNGGVGALGTLFSELMNNYKTKDGKYLIDGSVGDIVDFLKLNFVNSNGEAFEEASLKKYIYVNDKRAKQNVTNLDQVFGIVKNVK